MMPEGWNEVHLSERDIAVIDGDRGKNYPSAGELMEHGHCLFLSAKNVTKNGFAFDETQFVSQAKHQALRKGHVSRGDIVVTTRGTVGNVALYDCKVPYDVVRINSGMVVVRNTDPGVSTDYLDILFRSHVVQNQVQRLTFGSAQPQLTVGIINKFKLPFPPLAEQKKIAEILSAWDRAIGVAEAQLAAAHTQKRALMQQLLTGKRRFPEFEGEEWKEVRLGDVLREVKRPVAWSDSDLYRLVSVRRRSGGIFHREDLFGRDIKTKNLKNVLSGDFLISKMQVVHGAMGLVRDEFDGMQISGSYIAINSKDNSRLNIEFFDWLSRMPEVYHRAYLCSYGVHIEKMTFNFNLFLKERVKLPASVKEQEQIVEVLDCAEREVTELDQHITKLRTEKKALMQQLLTGKRRVVV